MNHARGAAGVAHGYAPVNGLEMYYEVAGTGDPLVCIPPAFGHAGTGTFPALARRHSVVTIDLQGHGRTADLPERPLSFEQHASDVIGLMDHLGIPRADFFGQSYGGVLATMLAVRHPGRVRRVATYGATFGPPGSAVREDVLHPATVPAPGSRGIQFQRESYERVAPDPGYWPTIWRKMGDLRWSGFSNDELAALEAPLLIAVGDHDFVRLEHALETFRKVRNAELAVIPDAGHFAPYSDADRVIATVEHFLEKPERRLAFATADTGYHPGETR